MIFVVTKTDVRFRSIFILNTIVVLLIKFFFIDILVVDVIRVRIGSEFNSFLILLNHKLFWLTKGFFPFIFITQNYLLPLTL
jgi:hypothetical protein